MVPKVELNLHTRAPPERVHAALIDFSDRRPDIWPGMAREQFKVYEVGDTWALVQEGNIKPVKVWAKERYDWSQPGVVSWIVQDSNFAKPGKGVTAHLSPAADGGTDVRLTWEREGKTLFHKVMIAMMAATGAKPVAASFRKALEKLEGS
jgi:hypothetical protein